MAGLSSTRLVSAASVALSLSLALTACGSESDPAAQEAKDLNWPCEVGAESATGPDYLQKIGCRPDFTQLASAPIQSTIPGAQTVKVVLDQENADALYFQNSRKYAIHHAFAAAHLSTPERTVPLLASFNETQYSAPDRRFLLGSVTYYEQPDVWALEFAPYDRADARMIEKLYEAVRERTYFGPRLAFVPNSEPLAAEAEKLASSVRVTTSEELFEDTIYQPLNLGETVARVRFLKADELETEYVNARDLVVLDQVPNDISVVGALITEQFQTPLSHVNVLARNRGTPNMGLRGATSNPELRALEGRWARLSVGSNEWQVAAATQAEADDYWELHKPAAVTLPPVDQSVRDLRNIEDLVTEGELPLGQAIKDAVLIFGAKAANYSILAKTADVPIRKAFAVPVYYYVQFMQENGFFEKVDDLLADPTFQSDPKVRDRRLEQLREEMTVAPVNQEFQALLRQKIASDYSGQTMRFRTSTNAEDLDGFPCAGCYDSHTGDPANWDGDLLQAVRRTWSTVWYYRTFEERALRSIDHKSVAMALLVHPNFPAEEANGVAVTANPFDPSGLEGGFYVNVQLGGAAEVVHPPPGVTSDEFLYYFDSPNQPVRYLAHSNLVRESAAVLTRTQIYELGVALKAIHARFSPAYGPASGNAGWYGMDVEFKFDDVDVPGQPAKLFVKQARPYPAPAL